MPGRIEIYLHSDMTTPNKGGAMVRVLSETDFATRTGDFVTFTKLVALSAYAAQTTIWREIIAAFPDLEEKKNLLEHILKEKVEVKEIMILLV